jgi:hypothetical protein
MPGLGCFGFRADESSSSEPPPTRAGKKAKLKAKEQAVKEAQEL